MASTQKALTLPSADIPRTRLATRLAFLAAGLGMGCWSPLVPYAKARVGVDEAALGLLLLCLGIGSIVAMPLTGMLTARLGARPIVVTSGITMAAMLPLLALVESGGALAVVLLVFGGAVGTLDVAMNVHAVQVERASHRPLMSGFHALFSIGGFAGSGSLTLLLSAGVAPTEAALCGSVVVTTAILIALPRLLRTRPDRDGALLALPRGVVLLVSMLAFIAFLMEGAVLDWGALLATQTGLVPLARGGLGYTLFSIAMTAGRFGGDAIVARAGRERVLIVGGCIVVAGFAVLLLVPMPTLAMAGFLLIGAGASNIVPVLFSQAGRQTAMPAGLAVAALTTTGYAGILAGPAAIGMIAHAVGLPGAFWLLAGLMGLIPILTRRAMG